MSENFHLFTSHILYYYSIYWLIHKKINKESKFTQFHCKFSLKKSFPSNIQPELIYSPFTELYKLFNISPQIMLLLQGQLLKQWDLIWST